MTNPIFDDRTISFLLHDCLEVETLCEVPHFEAHSRETIDMYLEAVQKLARERLLPLYRSFDEDEPELENGSVRVHPFMAELYPQLVELGVLNATRPEEVGGVQLPWTVYAVSLAYLYGANLGALAFASLTSGAAHLIEAFGSDALKERYMAKMYSGEWTGTMALTEPDAGSSLADLTTRATLASDGSYRLSGTKVYISGGDQNFTENIVHLTLARIDGAPAGTKGISLFAVPAKRVEADGSLVDNDLITSGLFHKLGWRGIPSISLTYGERGDCHGFLVGEEHQGLKYMFQMMNEARIGVGLAATATASVAYHESLAFAKDRLQGRPLSSPSVGPQIPIIQHADVRRMLLRQKAIVEGALALALTTAKFADLAAYGPDDGRQRAHLLLDLLTPMAKTFPAERGFESNALAVQVLGGSGYVNDYMTEAWLRDQKLNSIHEGTSGIQAMDLLGRKVMKTGGQSLMALGEEISGALEAARSAGVDENWCAALEAAVATLTRVTTQLGTKAMGDAEGMMRNASDYFDLISTLTVGWQWLVMATAAKSGIDSASGSESD
ncbi:MAG: acyl-CoA dehydrogenase, partial [Myxococcota bacterium]